jgi:hypothetical protein
MMTHTIESTPAGLHVRVFAAPDAQRQWLEDLQRGTTGACDYPSLSAGNLQSIRVVSQATALMVDLEARPGRSIDVADIERCLAHTAERLVA